MTIKYYSESYRRKQEWLKKRQTPLNYSLRHAILDILYDLGESSVLFGNPRKQLDRWARGIPKPPRWRYNRAIKYLESLGQIKLSSKNDQIFIKLTKKGKLQALLLRMENDFARVRKWDGKWRVIIWDIPESSRKQRNRMRYAVKDLGFYQLQKSVFITPFPLPASAVQYLRESGLLKFIRFLRVDKLDDDRFLKKHFGVSI